MQRREFLRTSGAALAALGIGCNGRDATSKINVGMIGVGGFGSSDYHLGYMLASPRVKVLAVADPDQTHVDAALAAIGPDAIGYRDYRELLARDDIDAVVVVTPDHWHAQVSIDAANAGKHVYCEKPLTLTVAEGRAIVNAVSAAGIAFQTGSQQRSTEEFHYTCELVRNGGIGELQKIEVSIYGAPIMPAVPADPQPQTLDWDLWLGQTPLVPYHQLRAAGTFRYFRDYSGGTITDLGAHELDIAQWGAGKDGSGPVTIGGSATYAADNFFESPTEFDVRFTYADGLPVRFKSSTGIWCIQFFGSEGDVLVGRDTLIPSDPGLLRYKLGSGPVVLPYSRDHHGNWLDAIENGTPTVADAEIGHRSATLCHLANIAIETNRTLTWDPVSEKFAGDPAADALLSRAHREGY